jgi:hypothetical protein
MPERRIELRPPRGTRPPEAALFDDSVGPDARHQLAVFDDFAGALHQKEENLARPAAQPKGRIRTQEHSLLGIKPERSERNLLAATGLQIIGRQGLESLA